MPKKGKTFIKKKSLSDLNSYIYQNPTLAQKPVRDIESGLVILVDIPCVQSLKSIEEKIRVPKMKIWRGILMIALALAWAMNCVMCNTDEADDVWKRFGAEHGSVIELNGDNFEAAINTFDNIFVDFYAPWCGHCKRLNPELDAAAPVLAKLKNPVILAKLNADKFTKLASKNNVSAYPSLKFFKDGFPINYYGPRKAESLVHHLKKLSAPYLTHLKSFDELNEFVRDSGKDFPIFIGFAIQESLLIDFATHYKSRAWFAITDPVPEKAMVEFDFDKTPALVAIRPEYNEQDVFYGPFEGEFLEQFIQQSMLPLSVPIRYESLKLLEEDKRPIMLAIMNDETEEMSIRLIKILKAAASANRNLVFAHVGVKQWDDFADSFNVGKNSKLPMIFIWNGDSDYHIVEGLETLSEGNFESEISQFLEAYKQGRTIQKSMKGPSFMGFLQSLMSVRTLYTILFITAILLIILFMTGSDSREEEETANISDRSAEQRLVGTEGNQEVEEHKKED